MSGLTSQPSLNAIVESLAISLPRETGVDPMPSLIEVEPLLGARSASPLFAVRDRPQSAPRPRFTPTRCLAASTRIVQQAKASRPGLAGQEVCKAYADVNHAFWRHRQGDALVEGRGRHGAFPRRQQSDGRRHGRSGTASLPSRKASSSSSKVKLGQSSWRFPRKALQERVLKGRPRHARNDLAKNIAPRRSSKPPRSQGRESLLGRGSELRSVMHSAWSSILACSPTSPLTNGHVSPTPR